MTGDTPQQNRPAQEEQEREPQVAVAPLNAIAQEDIGTGAAKLDAWLQSISDGWITLARLSTVAGSIPVVGNIMALADAIMDVVRIDRKSVETPLGVFELARERDHLAGAHVAHRLPADDALRRLEAASRRNAGSGGVPGVRGNG